MAAKQKKTTDTTPKTTHQATTSVASDATSKPIPIAVSHSTPIYSWLALLAGFAIAIYMVYGGSFSHDFVDWDDYEYVKENAYVLNPSWNHAWLFFKSSYYGNYHPLTMCSYLVNTALWGKEAASFIQLNVLLHIVNTFLVCYLAYRLAGRSLWVGAFTALFFAIHPLHVESVVWVSERKDVLYGLFFIAACINYWAYIHDSKKHRYFLCLLLFLLACMSKPAAIVLPFVLLLLDDWQGRLVWQAKVWIEKLPFFALSFLFGYLTLMVQDGGDVGGFLPSLSAKAFAISDLNISFWQRCQYAGYGFITYLLRLFVPHNMAAFHPYPTAISPIYALYPIASLALLSLAIYSRRYSKVAFLGIAFYAICLALVLQFVTVGSAIIADRYTYIPYIGILFAVFYALHHLTQKKTALFYPISGAAAAIALLFAIQAKHYTKAWKDTIVLWDNVINLYPNTSNAYTMRGTYKGKNGDLNAAVKDFEHALSLDSTYAATYEGLGNVYGYQQQPQKALEMFEKALQYDSNNGKSYFNRALANVQLEQYERVLPDLDRALTLTPNRAMEILSLRGFTYLKLQQYPQSIEAYSQSLKAQPNNASAYLYRGMAYYNNNNKENAKTDFNKALQLNPKLSEAQQYLNLLGQ